MHQVLDAEQVRCSDTAEGPRIRLHLMLIGILILKAFVRADDSGALKALAKLGPGAGGLLQGTCKEARMDIS